MLSMLKVFEMDSWTLVLLLISSGVLDYNNTLYFRNFSKKQPRLGRNTCIKKGSAYR